MSSSEISFFVAPQIKSTTATAYRAGGTLQICMTSFQRGARLEATYVCVMEQFAAAATPASAFAASLFRLWKRLKTCVHDA